MRKTDVKKEKPPVRLLGTMFLLVLGLVAVYVVLALGILALVQKLVHLDETNYTLLWPILILSVSAILGVLLAVFIFRGYLAPLSRLMQATQSVAAGDYSVRVEMRGARGEVAEYIRSFNKMAEELSSVALLRMDFVNTFSHEFKTPLISIRGFAKLLQNDDLTPQQRQTYTDTVVQQSERLAAMSTHILELAQYENTEIVSGKAVYSLDEQLRRCVRQQERDWLKKGLTVEGDLDRVDYYGNEELAEHIWSNLLSNAIRFTPADGQITIVLRQGEGEVTVSIAHTTADYGTSMEAFRLGARQVTHLFNAMPAFSHRAPGVVGAALDTPLCNVELICDGVHIHPSVVRAVFKMFGSKRVILISDTMRAAGMPDGDYTLGGQAVQVKGNRATLSDGTLAGSVTDLMKCMKTAVSFGIPLADAVRAAAVNPAMAIGIFSRVGSLEPGKRANVVVLDQNLDVKDVFFRGELVSR